MSSDPKTTGRVNLLVGQSGEYLVAAELSRRGFIVTTFKSNVPHYDLIASDVRGRHVSIQVKASTGSTWRTGRMDTFCEISFDGHRQIVGRKKRCPIERLLVVLVRVDAKREDRFYICRWNEWRDVFVAHHKAYLAKHDGVRPKSWKSLHAAIDERSVARFQDRWEVIEKSLR